MRCRLGLEFVEGMHGVWRAFAHFRNAAVYIRGDLGVGFGHVFTSGLNSGRVACGVTDQIDQGQAWSIAAGGASLRDACAG